MEERQVVEGEKGGNEMNGEDCFMHFAPGDQGS